MASTVQLAFEPVPAAWTAFDGRPWLQINGMLVTGLLPESAYEILCRNRLVEEVLLLATPAGPKAFTSRYCLSGNQQL
ncbi:MAG: hypothetical protein IPP30_14415 [Flavobacterium sp.]|nr:hypothetical protein [Flavobacterium sp.]